METKEKPHLDLEIILTLSLLPLILLLLNISKARAAQRLKQVSANP